MRDLINLTMYGTKNLFDSEVLRTETVIYQQQKKKNYVCMINNNFFVNFYI